jgi:hypothetical protein
MATSEEGKPQGETRDERDQIDEDVEEAPRRFAAHPQQRTGATEEQKTSRDGDH